MMNRSCLNQVKIICCHKEIDMNILGKPSVNPFLFFSGKLTGYAVWIILPLSAADLIGISRPTTAIAILSLVVAGIGVMIAVAGLINLGSATRFGLPSEKTEFKTGGIYRISRNPIYLGFGLLTAGSVIYHYEFIPIFIAALYSLAVYHIIILSEERFLRNRFGKKYDEYMKRTRRYL